MYFNFLLCFCCYQSCFILPNGLIKLLFSGARIMPEYRKILPEYCVYFIYIYMAMLAGIWGNVDPVFRIVRAF